MNTGWHLSGVVAAGGCNPTLSARYIVGEGGFPPPYRNI